MSIQNNICEYYNELVESLAERARLNHEEELEKEREECVFQAINEGMIYGDDQAYMLAYAMIEGTVEQGQPVIWADVWAMLEHDVYEASQNEWEDEEE